MIIVGIDTSCDDTSVAVLKDGKELLSNIVSSQADLHGVFGGIVPELASRKHIELIERIYTAALDKAGLGNADIDAIAVTNGPGLIGSLLIGLSFAKGLSVTLGKPLYAVNHIQAHAMSIFLEKDVPFPFVALVVSGGHTIILSVEDPLTFRIVGTTRDDAAGEAFDKIAKYLGIGYPGGKIIEDRARQGRRDYVRFPRPMLDENTYDFSFSGLKTAFVNYAKKHTVTDDNMADVLASFQEAAFDVLVRKVVRAVHALGMNRVVIGGGVAANGRLREIFHEAGEREGLEAYFSSPRFCTDNGAMIALTASYAVRKGDSSPLDVRAYSRMKISL